MTNHYQNIWNLILTKSICRIQALSAKLSTVVGSASEVLCRLWKVLCLLTGKRHFFDGKISFGINIKTFFSFSHSYSEKFASL